MRTLRLTWRDWAWSLAVLAALPGYGLAWYYAPRLVEILAR